MVGMFLFKIYFTFAIQNVNVSNKKKIVDKRELFLLYV